MARYIESDVHNKVSRTWLDSMLLTGRTFVAPELMLLEVASAIARRLEPGIAQQAYQQMQAFQRLQYTPVDRQLLERAVDIAMFIRLRSADCLYVALAEQLKLPLVTWDREIIERANGRIRVFEPSET